MVKTNAKNRRTLRVRSKIKKTAEKRLVVFRSNKHFFAQIIDNRGKVIVAVNQKEIVRDAKGKTKSEKAVLLGELMAVKAKKTKLKKIVFDRGPYRYHGRVKAFAESVRKGGLTF